MARDPQADEEKRRITLQAGGEFPSRESVYETADGLGETNCYSCNNYLS